MRSPQRLLSARLEIRGRLFRAIVGRRFKVRAIQREPLVLLRLDVSKVGVPLLGSTAHEVFIEPEYVA